MKKEYKLSINAPAGSRLNGYDDIVVQDFPIEGRVVRYRRERWVAAEAKLIKAPLPVGLRGHFGSELARFILLQHY